MVVSIGEQTRRIKISKAMTGRKLTEEHKQRLREAKREYRPSLEHMKKLRQLATGRECSPETRMKIGEANRGIVRTEEQIEQNKQSTSRNWRNSEYRRRQSESQKEAWSNPSLRENMMRNRSDLHGENNPNWKGGTSFGGYCPKFNFRLKERIRNESKRCCALCGKSEILNGRRLSVHHIDRDRTQGCDGRQWNLVALCSSCHRQMHSVESAFFTTLILLKGGQIFG